MHSIIQVPDPRLETVIIRPIVGEGGESYLSYYLTAEEAESEEYKSHRDVAYERSARQRTKSKNSEDEEPIAEQKVKFHFVRDYETVKIDIEVPNEFLLMLNSGEGADLANVSGDEISGAIKGAFYKNIERKYVLRKKRQMVSRTVYAEGSILTCSIQRQEDYGEQWDIIYAMSEPLSDELWREREEAVAEVQNPDFLANAAAAQMELNAAETQTRDHAEAASRRPATPIGDVWLNEDSDTDSPAARQTH